MHYEGKLKLRSYNTSYWLKEVITKTGVTVSRVEKYQSTGNRSRICFFYDQKRQKYF